jgi:hypothetical protein
VRGRPSNDDETTALVADRLSTHFQALCAVELDLERTADCLASCLQRFGPVERVRRKGCDDALRWLLPLTSFSSRYLLVPCSRWTVLLTNGQSTAAIDQLCPVSEAASCRGVYGSWEAEGCMWRLLEKGRDERSVVCYRDDDRWVFHQQGTPLSFEDRASYAKRRKRDRLPPELVRAYLGQIMSVAIPPSWRQLLSQETVCLERSTAELRVPIEEYVVDVDL